MRNTSDIKETLFDEIYSAKADFFLVDEAVASAAGLLGELDKPNCKRVLLSGKKSRTCPDFMEEVYGKLKFPSYFGRNWSAFSDSFQERLWQDEDHYQQYLLVFTDADDLLADAVDDDLSALLETLQDTIEALADPESIMAIKVVFCLKNSACSRIGVGIINGNHQGKVVQSDRSTPSQQTAPAASII